MQIVTITMKTQEVRKVITEIQFLHVDMKTVQELNLIEIQAIIPTQIVTHEQSIHEDTKIAITITHQPQIEAITTTQVAQTEAVTIQEVVIAEEGIEVQAVDKHII